MFATAQGPIPALSLAFPDVCLTPIPTPVGPIPVPLPYPNISLAVTAIPIQFRYLITGMPAHNLMTFTPMSNGDNAGLMMNPLSGMVMGPSRSLMGSVKTIVGCFPVTKMLMPTGQNGVSPGAFGVTLCPSQVRVMILG